MNKYLSSSLNSVVSIDLETSWAAQTLKEALQQARYDVRISNEKEYKTIFFSGQISTKTHPRTRRKACSFIRIAATESI